MEDDELAAVEADVERKRVAKNPFEHKFTTLTESPFADPHQRGDSQEMKTISRHIIVRTEVISKQIAFLSKHTAGQPEKVLAGAGLTQNTSSADGFQQDISASDEHCRVGARRRRNLGEVNAGTPCEDGTTTVKGNGPPLGPHLSARVDLYRRLRQGVATPTEILPGGLRSQSLRSLALSPSSWTENSGDELSSCSTSLPIATREKDSLAQTRREKSVDAASGAQVPPGVLHQFIKHVRPFSVCLETTGPGKKAESSSTIPPIDRHGGAVTETGDSEGGVGSLVTTTLDMSGQACDSGDGTRSGTEMPMDMPSIGNVLKKAGADHGLLARTPTHLDRIVCGDDRVQGDDWGGRGCGDLGAPRKPTIPEGGSEALRRAKARLQGKRKLAYSTSTTTDISDGETRQLASCPEKNATQKGKKGDATLIARGVPHCQPKEVKASREATGKNADDSVGGWISFSWRGAKELRKCMERAAAREGRRSTSGTLGKKGRRSSRKGGPIQVTVSDDTARANTSGIGSLSFVSSNVHTEIPEVTDAKDYLVSVANPARDLAAMKRAFQDNPRSVSKEMVCSLESPIRSLMEADMSDSDDFPLGNNEAFQDKEGRHCNLKTEHLKPDSTGEPKKDRSVVPKHSSSDTQNVKSGICVIDLKNIWRRTGAISLTISETIKASEERTSLANGLRESFRKLDLRCRLEDQQTQEVLSYDSNDGRRQTRNEGDISMSVSLRHPPQDDHNAAAASPSKALSGDVEGAARMFALVVSLAHVHNVSGPHGAAGTLGGSSAERLNAVSSQLHVELDDGGKKAIVTARGK